jgi:hypothetical protein
MGGKYVAIPLNDIKTDNNRLTLDRSKELTAADGEIRARKSEHRGRNLGITHDGREPRSIGRTSWLCEPGGAPSVRLVWFGMGATKLGGRVSPQHYLSGRGRWHGGSVTQPRADDDRLRACALERVDSCSSPSSEDLRV